MRLTSAILLVAAVAVSRVDQACGSDACCARHSPDGIRVLDPTVSRPEDWDDEDDGEWVRSLSPQPQPAFNPTPHTPHPTPHDIDNVHCRDTAARDHQLRANHSNPLSGTVWNSVYMPCLGGGQLL